MQMQLAMASIAGGLEFGMARNPEINAARSTDHAARS